MRQVNDTEDIGEKPALFEKANNAYKRYEEYNRQYDLIEKKLNKALGLWMQQYIDN